MARKNARRRSRKRSRKRSKKVARLTRRQARTKKYDSVYERVAARVARKEIQKQEVRLIARKFWYSTYDATTNAHSGAVPLTFTGFVLPVSQIPTSDIEFQSKQSVDDLDESPMVDESLGGQGGPDGATGPGVGTLDVPLDGYRRSSFIKVKGFSMQLRCFIKKLEDDDVSQRYDNGIVHYRLVHVRDDEMLATQNWEPTADRCLPIRPWGYSAKLDAIEAGVTSNFKCKTLMKGSISLHPTQMSCVQKNVNRYAEFTKPIFLEYGKTIAGIPPTIENDQTGQFPLRGALFLVLRSNIPAAAVNDQIRVSAVTKLYYVDN